MTLRTDSLTQSLPQKGTTPMAKRKAPAPALPSHHQTMGMAAHAAMQNLGSTGRQHAAANPMDFNVVGAPAQQEDFTPRAYRSKPNPQG